MKAKRSTDFFKGLLKKLKKMKRERKRLEPGYFYMFTYKAETPIRILKFYDSTPIVYVISKKRLLKGSGYLAINFNWIPASSRKSALRMLINASNGNINRVKKDKKIKLPYKRLKKGRLSKIFKLTIRSYYYKNITKLVKVAGTEILENIEYSEATITGSQMGAKQALKLWKEHSGE